VLAKVTGTILEKLPGKVLLKVGPIVLEVLTPFSLYEHLPTEGSPFSFHVVLRLRGETFELYGFADDESRELFQRLQGIPRLGPRLALNILSVFSPEKFREVVAGKEVERLSRVPGIGPKLAERLCVELRSRLDLARKPKPKREKPFEEALSALLNLGFSSTEATAALEEVYQAGEETGEIVRKALKRLAEGVKGA